jgi:hypothetical protein
MRDPRLQNELFEARQQELVQQAKGDRLAAAEHAEQRALADVLAVAGRALLSLSMRLAGETASLPVSAEAADVPTHERRCLQPNGRHPEWIEGVGHTEGAAGAATATSTLVAHKSRPTASKTCS